MIFVQNSHLKFPGKLRYNILITCSNNYVSPVIAARFYFLEVIILKRIKEACICQTLHFMLKDDIPHDMAVRFVREEIEKYKASLEKNRTQYKIVEETEQPDGSVIIKIKKQYNSAPVGGYLD